MDFPAREWTGPKEVESPLTSAADDSHSHSNIIHDNINTIEEINKFLIIKREKVMKNLVEVGNLREEIRQLDRKLDKICDHKYEHTGESYGMYERPPKRCCKCLKDK